MLDLAGIHKRYFRVKFRGRCLDLEPPKLKIIRRMLDIVRSGQTHDANAAADLIPLTAQLLSKNKQRFCVSPEMVEESLDWDGMLCLFREFFAWLNAEKQNPN